MRRVLLVWAVLLGGCGVGDFRLRAVPVEPQPVWLDGGSERAPDAGAEEPLDAGVVEPPDAGSPRLALTARQTVAAGALFSCALAQADVYCWGKNEHGQLGSAPGGPIPTATRVPAVAGAIEVSAGQDHACALTGAGQVWCWGANGVGQLGRGTQGPTGAPGPVPGLTDARALSVGGQGHTCVLHATGRVSCWGRGLGNTGIQSAVPVLVAGLTGAQAVSAGDHHVCAVLAQGALWCWGGNFHGALGDGTRVDRQSPAQVGLLPPVAQVSAGNGYVCAVTAGGQVWCWGRGESGQLGGTTPEAQSVAKLVSGATADRVFTSAGLHTCARAPVGAIWCWGSNAIGQLGGGPGGIDPELAPVATDVVDATDAAAGAFHTCARRAGGTVACWGLNSDGQLGNGQTNGLSKSSVTVVGLP